MAISKGLRADPAYRRMIDLAQATGDIDLVRGMKHLSYNSRLDKDFVIYDGTSVVGRAAFHALGLPREGITVRQAMVRAHAYAASRGYREFAEALNRYLGIAEGSTPTDVRGAAPAVGGAPYRRQERQSAPQDQATVLSQNPDLIDRGTVAHMDIQDLLSDFVQGRGLQPLQPLGGDPQFDLAWRESSSVVVCEVKTLTAENEVSQLRLGLGQVLSYIYKLNWRGAHEVRGVLAVEREPVDADWVNICADHDVTLTWAPDFQSLFPLGVPKVSDAEMTEEMPTSKKPRTLHHRVYPYMDHFVQHANDRRPERSPWIVRDRSTALRNERQGRGRALFRVWAPGAWEELNVSSPQDGNG